MSGVVFTPAAADRIGRAVRWVESRRQAGDSPVGPARGVEPVWVRLTSGTADGDGHYPGVITLYSGVGEAWSDYSAVKVAPLNGETLSNATRYAVRPSGRTSSGDELYTVIGTTVAAGTIEVEAADGTPAYASITTLTFDQADGFSLSNPSAGVAAVDLLPATESQAGIVSTSAQEFGGFKNFQDGVSSTDITADSLASSSYATVGGCFQIAHHRFGSHGRAAVIGTRYGTYLGGYSGDWDGDYTGAPDFDHSIYFYSDWDVNPPDTTAPNVGGKYILLHSTNLWFRSTHNWVGDGPTKCATGTLTDGSDVVNGLITDIGDGSAVAEAAQDAVGGILGVTDTVTLTYTDSPAAITAVVNLQGSLTSDAGGLKLSGDSATPGNSKLYGTDSSGVKGWYDRPSGDIDGGTW